VRLQPEVLYVDEGDLLTSAGTTSGLDLCLHVVREDHGAEVANQLARIVVMPPHREGGQAQFIERPFAIDDAGSRIRPVLEWARERLTEPLTVEDLARQARMSTRSFTRRFKQSTGTTPAAWLLEQRLDLARRLLETTDHPVELIAARSGFGSSVTLRHHFARRLHTSPRAYRRTFGERAAGRHRPTGRS
jgi:transcriptional regulator GlxA family with amidase domain